MSTQLDAQFTANESNQLTAEELFQSQGLFILPTLPTHMSSTPAADPKRPRSDLRRDILGLPGGGKGTFGQAGIGRNVNGRMLELWRREKHVHATGSGSFLLPSALPFMSQTGTCAGPSDFFSPHLKGHAWDGIGGSAIALGPKKKKKRTEPSLRTKPHLECFQSQPIASRTKAKGLLIIGHLIRSLNTGKPYIPCLL